MLSDPKLRALLAKEDVMSDDERARELREEIAALERWAAKRSVFESPAIDPRVTSRAYHRQLKCVGVESALAEAQAEFTALEAKREPTIEERFQIGCRARYAEYAAKSKPAPMRGIHSDMAIDETRAFETRAPRCEAPGWFGREHAVDATDYGTCRVCGASASDRKAARRRVFDVAVGTTCLNYEGEDEWMAVVEYDEAEAYGPTRELAIEALFAMLEAARKE